MPRPPKPCMHEFTCNGCGRSYVEQGVDVPEDFPRRCFHCATDGHVSYYTRTII